MQHLGVNIMQFLHIDPYTKTETLDISGLRKMCAHGLSECPPEDRCVIWLCLLDVFPKEVSEWHKVREEVVSTYKYLVHLFEMDDWIDRRFKANVQKTAFGLKDNARMHTIHGDIVRTGRHIFFLPTDEPETPCESEILAPFAKHMRRLERILYIFAGVNSTLSYMQGFNELLPVLYFVVLQGGAVFDNDIFEIEAMAFKFFQQLMTSTSIQDLYTTVDQSSIIVKKLQTFDDIFKRHAPNLFKITQDLSLQPLLYSYRWFNLLYAQEYELPTLLIIWDSLFAHSDCILDFAFYFGVATIKSNAELLVPENFADTIVSLQTMKAKNVFKVIKDANEMYNIDHAPKVSKQKFSFFRK